MAKDFQFDDNFDLVYPPAFAYDLDEITQALLSIVVTPLGRFLNPNVGLNYDWIIGGFDAGMANTMIKDALNQDERVTHVDYVKSSVEDNHQVVDIDFKVQTTLGAIELRKEVNVNALNR